MDKKQITTALTDVSNLAVKKFKQELLAQNEEWLEKVLRKYKPKIARRAWHISQKWCRWDDEGPVLFPDRTRLYYRRANTEFLVQEFEPHVRLMRFKGNLVLRNNSQEMLLKEDCHKVYSYSIALPYTIFIFKFMGGLMEKVLVFFSDRPLKNLKEKPFRPFLSNINSEMKLCHGSGWQRSELIKGDLTQQVAYTLDLFWQTVYTDEWSEHWWAYLDHFSQNGDERMQSLANWQEASTNNPLFVVEDVQWLPHKEANFGNVIVKLFDHDEKDAQFQGDLYNDLIDNFIDEVKNTLMQNFRDVEEKINIQTDIDRLANDDQS